MEQTPWCQLAEQWLLPHGAELDPLQRARFVAHAAGCQRCRAAAGALAPTSAHLAPATLRELQSTSTAAHVESVRPSSAFAGFSFTPPSRTSAATDVHSVSSDLKRHVDTCELCADRLDALFEDPTELDDVGDDVLGRSDLTPVDLQTSTGRGTLSWLIDQPGFRSIRWTISLRPTADRLDAELEVDASGGAEARWRSFVAILSSDEGLLGSLTFTPERRYASLETRLRLDETCQATAILTGERPAWAALVYQENVPSLVSLPRDGEPLVVRLPHLRPLSAEEVSRRLSEQLRDLRGAPVSLQGESASPGDQVKGVLRGSRGDDVGRFVALLVSDVLEIRLYPRPGTVLRLVDPDPGAEWWPSSPLIPQRPSEPVPALKGEPADLSLWRLAAAALKLRRSEFAETLIGWGAPQSYAAAAASAPTTLTASLEGEAPAYVSLEVQEDGSAVILGRFDRPTAVEVSVFDAAGKRLVLLGAEGVEPVNSFRVVAGAGPERVYLQLPPDVDPLDLRLIVRRLGR